MNCYHCVEDFVITLKTVKDNIGEHVSNYTHKLVNESRHVIDEIGDSAVVHFFEDINNKLINLKDKVSDIIEVHEESWMDIFEQGNGKYIKLSRWPVFVQLICAIICLGCSAIFHLFSAHSHKTHAILNRLDYAGISILIAGSCYPPYFYFFYCEPCKNFFKVFNF